MCQRGLKHTVVIQPNYTAWGVGMRGDIRMQLTFFIGQEIKCPGQSICLNHACIFTACLREKFALMLLQLALMKESGGGDRFR